ncbi:FAD-dependent oxidoreductase [uncultured Ilyobacter sp.]|uniref:FAD-dependent oxidoreductase n=1 Tax=uncultured Ilyobacter sp. TaxID=544433 RepID=UPI0029C682DA|nr:FAD-dependent oxidoreductase [uncultured Ilyobacter sp.]
MKIVIIGSVAAGTSVAAKARRNNEECEITIYEKDSDISYSGCGLPYYIGDRAIERDVLTPRTDKWFEKRFNMDLKIGHEVMSINKDKKTLVVKNITTGEEFEDNYDKLVIATGASPIKPPIAGIEGKNVFFLRNVKSADNIIEYIASNSPKKAVVIGAGYIGLELLENLENLGIEVTVVEREDRAMSKMDKDMAVYLEDYLTKKGVNLILGEEVTKINEKSIETAKGKKIDADFTVVCTGVRPNSQLASGIGVEVYPNGAVKVNHKLETNIDDIYAVGDVAMAWSIINGEPMYVPLGSTANKMGRICGDVITGGQLRFKGILGTGIFKVFDMAVASTGMTEEQAVERGYNVEVVHNIKPNQTTYFKTSREMVIKAVADRGSGKLLGVQILGENGVDKRMDVFVALMSTGATVDEFFHLDLAYAPPFSTTKDPVMYTGMILDNAIYGKNKIMTVNKLIENRDDYIVIDVRASKQYDAAHIPGAINIPLGNLRAEALKLDKNKKYVVHCNKGVTGNAAQNVMLNLGFDCYNLSGGYKNYAVQTKN